MVSVLVTKSEANREPNVAKDISYFFVEVFKSSEDLIRWLFTHLSGSFPHSWFLARGD